MRSSQAVETRRFLSLDNLSHKNSAGWKLKKGGCSTYTYLTQGVQVRTQKFQ